MFLFLFFCKCFTDHSRRLTIFHYNKKVLLHRNNCIYRVVEVLNPLWYFQLSSCSRLVGLNCLLCLKATKSHRVFLMHLTVLALDCSNDCMRARLYTFNSISRFYSLTWLCEYSESINVFQWINVQVRSWCGWKKRYCAVCAYCKGQITCDLCWLLQPQQPCLKNLNCLPPFAENSDKVQ